MAGMGTYSIRRELADEEKKELAQYPELQQHLLFHRGIKGSAEADSFLNPDYAAGIHNPYLMKDMEKSVKRIVKAVLNNEKIIVFTDYDCDGIPAAVVMHDFFKKIGYGNFENYIPHRHLEGFGLNLEAIEAFAKGGAQLLLTADCGITDIEEIEKATELGIDVILTDHHLPGEAVPKAYAILNPKQEGCEYPEKMLCGSGVIFKLVQGLLKDAELQNYLTEKNIEIKEGWDKWLLDMVGLATLSDMVPLRGENRVIAYYGLKVLRKSPRVGLMKLLSKLKTNQKHLVEEDIGFTISPRINAASRMGIPMEAFRLLSTDDEVEADQLVEYLNKINDERKGTVAAIIKEIKKKNHDKELKSVIVMGNPDWKPALLGLAANTLMREHARPVFLWGREGGELIKGSCRSDGSANLVDVMKLAAPGTFVDFGGHKLSGGFSVSHEKIHLLEEELGKAYELAREKLHSAEENFIDKKLMLDEVDWKTYGLIEKLGPFGEANPKPVFLFERSEVSQAKLFGKESNHLELAFRTVGGKKITAIYFFAADKPDFLKIRAGDKIDLVATMEKSMFRNFPELRLRIVDII
jgi:single-stranded-DNA-specific exonuclease